MADIEVMAPDDHGDDDPKGAPPAVPIRQQLDSMQAQFAAALPAHVPVERFARVLMTAVQQNPKLLNADRRSFWNAAMKAAQDGLLPDGREGAMVIFKSKTGPMVQWMPMIAGLRKKVRNSGELVTWDAHVVHENDQFEYELGDEPFIRHRPALTNPGKVIAAYSVVTLQGGEKSREIMSVADIEKVRAASRAKSDGPWVSWYEEMCRKTVARRHAKSLPMSTDLDDLLRRDDDLYQFDDVKEDATEVKKRTARTLEDFAAPDITSEDITDDDEAETQPQQSQPKSETATTVPSPPSPGGGTAGADRVLPPGSPDPAGDPIPDQPSAADQPQEPIRLSLENKATLQKYSDDLLNGMSARGLQQRSTKFLGDAMPDEGTPMGNAINDLFKLHLGRVNGDSSPAECEQQAKKLIGRL